MTKADDMIIIIEGTDASGKSTLVSALTRVAAEMPNSLTALHFGRPSEMSRRGVLNEYVNSIDRWYGDESLIISDRWHWGEATYAPLKRPETNVDGFGLLGVSGWRWVEMYLMSRGASVFWLRQPLDVITSRLTSRGDDYINVDELSTILDLYAKTRDQAPSVVAVVQPEDEDDPAWWASSIIARARINYEEARPLRLVPGYVGNVAPRALLVGDRRNIKSGYETETRLPFMPVDGNSGDFLLSSLPDPLWKNLGIVNGWEVADRLPYLWNALGCPVVIALGNEARKAITRYGNEDIEAVTRQVPHPQYVRRFHHTKRTEYGLAIQLAIEEPALTMNASAFR